MAYQLLSKRKRQDKMGQDATLLIIGHLAGGVRKAGHNLLI